MQQLTRSAPLQRAQDADQIREWLKGLRGQVEDFTAALFDWLDQGVDLGHEDANVGAVFLMMAVEQNPVKIGQALDGAAGCGRWGGAA